MQKIFLGLHQDHLGEPLEKHKESMETGKESEVKKRLKEFMATKGMSANKFCVTAGIDTTTFSRMSQDVNAASLASIARTFPELDMRYILTGKRGTENKTEVKTLPLIPFDAVAGPGTPVFEDSRVEEYYYVSEFKECDFLIRVKGDSMAPHFTGGDLLACRKVEETYFLQWNRCYVIYTRSQGCMVKRVQPSEKEGYIKCVSDNAKYAPFDVPMNDIVSVALVNGSISLE